MVAAIVSLDRHDRLRHRQEDFLEVFESLQAACLGGVCTLDPWDRMSVGLANSCPCPHNPAPTQAREVVSDLSAVQTRPQSARIRHVALPPIPLAYDDLVLPLSQPLAGQSSRKKAATDGAWGHG